VRQYYDNTNNFYRSVRNIVLDLRGGPAGGVTGFHWQVSQGTLFALRPAPPRTDPAQRRRS
jgi:hypothetical protein